MASPEASPQQSPQAGPEAARDPLWDLLRAIGILCVIGAHSVGPYMSRPFVGLIWPVYEPGHPLWKGDEAALAGPAPAITDYAFWIIRSFTVPLFFFVAGVFAARGLAKQPPRQFIVTRVRCLLPAFLAGTFVVLVVMYFIWAWGWVRFGYAAPGHILHTHFGPAVQHNLHGFGHLWYLYYLILSLALVVLLRPVMLGLARAAQRSALFARLVTLLTIIAASALLSRQSLHSVYAFDNSYLPVPGFFLFHFQFFVWGTVLSGAFLDAQSPLRRVCDRAWPVLLLIALVPAVWLVPRLAHAMHIQQNEPPPYVPGTLERAQVGALSGFTACVFILALVGMCARLAPRAPDAVLRLGRKTLWVYITHLAWVGFAVVVMFKLTIPAEVKAVIAFGFSLGVTTLTRPFAARFRVGRWLGA